MCFGCVLSLGVGCLILWFMPPASTGCDIMINCLCMLCMIMEFMSSILPWFIMSLVGVMFVLYSSVPNVIGVVVLAMMRSEYGCLM